MGRGQTSMAGESISLGTRPKARPERVRPGSYEWPELRIARLACWDGMDNTELDWFLLNCGAKNRRRGSTRILSEVACTYVRDTEMRGMVLDKYPKLRDDPRRAAALYRGIGKSLAQCIREADRQVREHERAVLDGERFGGTTGADGPTELSQMWQRTKFIISDQDVYGKYGLGFALDGNPELGAERAEIIKFLRREEKLDTSQIDSNWRAHAVFFDVRPGLTPDRIVMDYPVATPTSIVLGPPLASTNV